MEFDVEPTRNLYLSSIDKILTGSMLAGTRGMVGSKISGSLEYRGDQYYSSYWFNKTKRTNLGSNRHISYVCTDKLIWDSIVPSPFEIYLRGGGKFVKAEYDVEVWYNFWGPGAPPAKAILRELLVKTFIAKGNNSHITASNGSSISDNYWYSSSPFQYIYKNINRLTEPGVTTYFTNGYLEKLQGTDYLYFQKGTPNPLDFTRKVGISFVSGNNNTDSMFIQEVMYEYVVTPSVYSLLEQGLTATYQSLTNLSSKNFYEGFFGIRPNIIMATGSYINTSSFPQCQYSQSFAVDKQGWKFGLYNAFPTNFSVVFKRNSYGQIRDLLEPRKRTKTYEVLTRTFTSPIQITFVSDTQAYLTSSNPETLDTRETGIYNFEYQCGKPYVDNHIDI